MAELQIGDTIKCASKNEMVSLMHYLEKHGYETDFVYEIDGEKGLWLVITKIATFQKARAKKALEVMDDEQ